MMLLRSLSIYISTLGVLSGLRATRTAIFRNAYFLQPLFWRLCVVG